MPNGRYTVGQPNKRDRDADGHGRETQAALSPPERPKRHEQHEHGEPDGQLSNLYTDIESGKARQNVGPVDGENIGMPSRALRENRLYCRCCRATFSTYQSCP
jgi:hypothetical protein